MNVRRLFVAFLVAALTLFGSTASAQETGDSGGGGASQSAPQSSEDGGDQNGLEEGAISLSFTFPGGGNPFADGAAGVWYMVNDNFNLGINVGVGFDTENREGAGDTSVDLDSDEIPTRFDLFLAPTARYYLFEDSNVAPYILGQVFFQKFWDGVDSTTADPDEAVNNADKEFNSEEQPRFGLVGGFGLEWFPIEQLSFGGYVGLGIDLVRPNELDGNVIVQNGPRIGTLTSAVNANIYF